MEKIEIDVCYRVDDNGRKFYDYDTMYGQLSHKVRKLAEEDEKKPHLTLEEGQALLKVLLKEVKYGPVPVEKAQVKMEEITKNMKYPIDDSKRPIKDNEES